MNNLIGTHKGFLSKTYTYTFYLMLVFSVVERILLLLESGLEGNFFGLLIQILFFSFLVTISALLGTAVFGTILVVVLFIPYLLWRGLTTQKPETGRVVDL